MTLLDDESLAESSVVANSAMNRERQLTGPNSYERELGFNPYDWLTARAAVVHEVAWLDLCCGSGRALLQAGEALRRNGFADRVAIEGVDLVDYFVGTSSPPVTLTAASLASWRPVRAYNLITCVHGLHYIGDKLGLLTRVASWLTDDGHFVADLDLASVRGTDNRPIRTALHRTGFEYDSRRHRISTTGAHQVELAYTYRGADDHAGPNYTNQPAVDSYYDPA